MAASSRLPPYPPTLPWPGSQTPAAIANLGGTASWTSDVAKAGGWFALLDSFAAGYLGAAIVVNVSTGKSLLPLFPTKLWKS